MEQDLVSEKHFAETEVPHTSWQRRKQCAEMEGMEWKLQRLNEPYRRTGNAPADKQALNRAARKLLLRFRQTTPAKPLLSAQF